MLVMMIGWLRLLKAKLSGLKRWDLALAIALVHGRDADGICQMRGARIFLSCQCGGNSKLLSSLSTVYLLEGCLPFFQSVVK